MAEYKYKIGDKVRIREDLKSGIQYGDVTYVSEMDKYKGKVATITNYAGVYHPSYFIDLDEETYYWTAEMFATYFPEDEEATEPKTVDVGYYLEYCGEQHLEDVIHGFNAENNTICFTTSDRLNQYLIPKSAIKWVIPHIEK